MNEKKMYRIVVACLAAYFVAVVVIGFSFLKI